MWTIARGRKAWRGELDADGATTIRHVRNAALRNTHISARFEEVLLGSPLSPPDGKSKGSDDGNTEEDSSDRYGEIEKVVMADWTWRRSSMGVVDDVGW